jgi:hypothetical protein
MTDSRHFLRSIRANMIAMPIGTAQDEDNVCDTLMALAALLAHRKEQEHGAKRVVAIQRSLRPLPRCELCHETLLDGSHGPGVCVGQAVPTPAMYEPGKAQQAHGRHRGKPS